MSGWFGASWGAPACDPEEHEPTPVGQPCARCGVPFTEHDQGVTSSLAGLDEAGRIVPTGRVIAYHVQCYLDHIICPGCPRCEPERFN